MLRRQPHEKDRKRIAIPDDLRASLEKALFQINESKRDSDVRIDYDDAIQFGNLVGGRVGSRKCPYEFVFYPDAQRGKSRWYLALHPLEIEDIVDGCMTEITLYCCKSTDCNQRSNDKEFLCDCDYVEDPYWGNIEFPAAVEALRRRGIEGISDSTTRQELIDKLGAPTISGGGEDHPEFGYIYPWIKYHLPDCQLRFEFRAAGRIGLVSLLEPDWKPGK